MNKKNQSIETQDKKLERILRCNMIYFRVALRKDQLTQWRWKSGILSTPNTLFDFLSMYNRVPKDRIRVFFATSIEFMDKMLVRENNGLLSNSITLEDFLKVSRKIDGKRIKELEFEVGLQHSRELIAKSVITRKLGDEHVSVPASSFAAANYPTSEAARSSRASNLLGHLQEDSEWSIGGDHDTPYTFALPVSTPQALAWARLLAKVQNGELIP